MTLLFCAFNRNRLTIPRARLVSWPTESKSNETKKKAIKRTLLRRRQRQQTSDDGEAEQDEAQQKSIQMTKWTRIYFLVLRRS